MGKSIIDTNKTVAMKVSINSIIVNLLLSGFKLFAGFIGNSSAMISDGVHSASDVFSAVIVMVGVNLSSKEPDEEHQYGHERFECVAAIILACVLFVTGLGIGLSGIEQIFSGSYDELTAPSMLALIASIISIAAKECMYWYTRYYAKKINSSVLMADAWHHRTDSMSSIGSFIGILGSIMGFVILDSIASLVICLFIVKASYEIFKDGINKMIDKSLDTQIIDKMKELILEQDGVYKIDEIKSRIFGSRVYLDVEISVEGSISLEEAHRIAHVVHDNIEIEFPLVKHCMIHVNPAKIDSED